MLSTTAAAAAAAGWAGSGNTSPTMVAAASRGTTLLAYERASNTNRSTPADNNKGLASQKRPTTFEKSRAFHGTRGVATPESMALAASVGVDLSKTKYLGDFDEKMAADAIVPWNQNCSVWIPILTAMLP
jgi:hypothetical protein